MLLGAARHVSAPGRARGWRGKRAGDDGFHVPIENLLATKLPAVQTDRSLRLSSRFELSSRSGRFWGPHGPRICQRLPESGPGGSSYNKNLPFGAGFN